MIRNVSHEQLFKMINLEKVSYFYPGQERSTLNNLTFSIQAGEFVGIIGPTGAGKSTLCMALNGIVPQFFGGRFFGAITVASHDTLNTPTSTLAKFIGNVFENPETQLVCTSVENEVAFTLENMGLPRDYIRSRIEEVLGWVRLSGLEKKSPMELSGGQKQRLAIAAALAAQPKILVLDEPTSQLDSVGAQEIFSTLKDLNQKNGITIIMVSHAVEELASYANRIILLSGGQVVLDQSPKEVFSQVETLKKHNLRPPDITQTYYLFCQKGLRLTGLPVTISEAETYLDQSTAQITGFEPIKIQPNPTNGYAQNAVSAHNLSFSYPDGTLALHNVTLNINKGDFVLITGPNGAGKSTLVKLFLNLLRPTSGQVALSGQDTSHIPTSTLTRFIGYIGQNPDVQLFNNTVQEEIEFSLKILGLSKPAIQQRLEFVLNKLGLSHLVQKHPLSLPRGDRARVVMAAVMATDPDIFILDEPTIGQDYMGSQLILNLMTDQNQLGKTIIVISHHLQLMPDYVKHAIVMKEGKILTNASLREVFYDEEILKSSYLSPPQAVFLSKLFSKRFEQKLNYLTPQELVKGGNLSI
jgi:energy-coupling factor transport system ATP-binding protein